ncbi:MAG: prolipoprotein diacylglyceryl transferase [Archangium sp.]|nr:prolipoprotein diacylglyceryl transferase [Archangium sp.]
MIPYLELPQLDLPLGQKIDIFGVLSAVGVMVGASLGARAARTYSPGSDDAFRDAVPWLVGCGLVGGHFMHIFAYHPELLVNDWSLPLRVWEGLSSMGGVLGALVGLFFFFRRAGVPILPYLDALALGTAPGWAIARVGCFFVHDHPGVRTDFPLAVAFPGGPRHDLGLYDVFILGGLSALLYGLARLKPKEGRLMGVLAVGYSASRFGLDFLRASDLRFVDRRYLGLTPAQYIVAVLFGVGVWLLVRPSRDVQLEVREPKP